MKKFGGNQSEFENTQVFSKNFSIKSLKKNFHPRFEV